jgi:hypothetical protein
MPTKSSPNFQVGDMIIYNDKPVAFDSSAQPPIVLIEKIVEGFGNEYGSHTTERGVNNNKIFKFAFGTALNSDYDERDNRIIREDNWKYWKKFST